MRHLRLASVLVEPLPLSDNDSGGVAVALLESGVCEFDESGDDFRDTMRAAAFPAAVTGIGAAVALSHCRSEAVESLISEGEMDAIV